MAKADAENPRACTQRMEKLFHDTAAELRSDVGGLERAFHDDDKKSELAWS
ncbi:MAG TPA: hypothetical protein VN694_13685 [Caulobacteraceae bacterium]|nr:hypothetical protein [Caulobacteraceae bacterium]